MYYEYQLIEGVLYCRITPGGQWIMAKSDHMEAVNALLRLTKEQRVSVFRLFCTACGEDDPSCHCQNDE